MIPKELKSETEISIPFRLFSFTKETIFIFSKFYNQMDETPPNKKFARINSNRVIERVC